MSKIADYDMFDYDYSTYWKKREYEHLAEKRLITRMLDKEKGFWFLDIGGSYGRLTSTYYDKYKNPIIVDYSLKTLLNNKGTLQSKYKNIILIAANAYKLPFTDNSMDGGLMVRVLHHIEKPEAYFKEVSRVLSHNAVYIQEFANKVHIKASLRALLRLNFKFFDTTPYEQPTKHNNEGTKEGVEGVFYNFHPVHILKMVEKMNLIVKEKKGCSFLRSQGLKKIMSPDLMLFFEEIFQLTLSWSNMSPSIFFKTEYQGSETLQKKDFQTIEEILVCPNCKNKLTFQSSEEAFCKKCKKRYRKTNDIWDFRIQ